MYNQLFLVWQLILVIVGFIFCCLANKPSIPNNLERYVGLICVAFAGGWSGKMWIDQLYKLYHPVYPNLTYWLGIGWLLGAGLGAAFVGFIVWWLTKPSISKLTEP